MKNKKKFLMLIVCIIMCFSFTSALASNDSDTIIDIYNFDEAELKLQEIAEKTGFHRNQVAELLAKGYSEKEIGRMNLVEVDEILTENMSDDELNMYYSHIAPRVDNNSLAPLEILSTGYCSICGYTPSPLVNWSHATATSGYNGNGCFHENSGTTQSNIDSKCYYAKMLGMYIFNVSTSSVLDFDYYMFGENYGSSHPDWAHEGVDLKYINGNGNPVRSPITGVVTVSSISNKWVSIYSEDLGITMNFQHLDNIDGLGDLSEGETVTRGQYLGDQSSTDGHVHVQVCTHNSSTVGCATIHSGRDTVLSCEEPYGYH